ncbi:hypothetical protein CLAFUW4_10676 [Fulvia fulva]|nr:hypothetical protein CLAFUR4_10681 [Fulvia fulva]WPV18829.1 hypothetical protein CLAFUW4_10676 [Fulvia fulva]WPV34431.1 hypothetical protein CLAFUW7_10678 [Fulvia fulva]
MSSIQGIIISPCPNIITTTERPVSAFEAELAALGFRTTTITIAAAKEAVWRGSPLSAAVGFTVKLTWLDTTTTPFGTTTDHASTPDNPTAAALLRQLEPTVGLEQPILLEGDILVIRENGSDIEAAQVALLCEFAKEVALPNNPSLGPQMFRKEFEKLRMVKIEDRDSWAFWVEAMNPIPKDPLAGLTGSARKNKKKHIKAREAKNAGKE